MVSFAISIQGQPCDDFVERTLAAGRTLRRRVESQIVPVGQVFIIICNILKRCCSTTDHSKYLSEKSTHLSQTFDKYNFQPSTKKRIVNFKNQVHISILLSCAMERSFVLRRHNFSTHIASRTARLALTAQGCRTPVRLPRT
jgi:hypothetical protein